MTAAAFDENGLVLAPVDKTFNLQLTGKDFLDSVMKRGMTYTLRVPVSKPGPYLVRAAVRDPATEGTGSAQQYVEIPDVAGGTPHGVVGNFIELNPRSKSAHPAGANAPAEDLTHGAAHGGASPRGSSLLYGYQIFNAQIAAGGHPELEVQCRLFRDGAQVWADKNTLPIAGAPDPKRLDGGGRLSLGRDMKPGAYVLQVIVTDKLAKGKFTIATQSVDFELEP